MGEWANQKVDEGDKAIVIRIKNFERQNKFRPVYKTLCRKVKFDDGVRDIILDAVEETVEARGIVLS